MSEAPSPSADGAAGATRAEGRGAARDWVSVRVRPGRNREAVLGALFAIGAQGVQETGEELRTALPASVDGDALVCAVLAASPDASVETEPLPNVDWSARWRDQIHAQDLGALVIAPPWLAGSYDPARTVVIDPGMAFGTGEHPTTRSVVRLMSRVIRVGDRVADLGAGSAVLSIAAAKLGAERVAAIEIDPDAIGNAEANVARNGVTGQVTVIEGDALALLPLLAPVRVVLANIISSVLIALLPAMREALSEDGRAILGGILFEERHELLAALSSAGWRAEAEDHEEAWWSLVIAPA